MRRFGEGAPVLRLGVLGAIAACAIALSACGDDSSSTTSSASSASSATTAKAATGSCTAKGPIKIGGISGITGPIPVSAGVEGAKAYFNELNANGGLCGQKVDYKIVDDKSDPQASATAARQLVLQDNVVSMISASFVDCAVNDKFYRQQNIKVMGIGINPACYHSPVFAMSNNGPLGSLLGNLYYAGDPKGLNKKKVCAELLKLPGYDEQFKNAVALWEKNTGNKIALYDNTLAATSDPTSYILKAKNAGCEAVVLVGNVALMPSWMKAVKAQGAENIDWLWPAPNYISSIPKTLGATGDGIVFTDPEMEPDVTKPEIAHIYEEVEKVNPKDGVNNIHIGGWLAAQVMTAAIKSIDGEVTRDSVTKALETMPPFKTDLMGGPFVFGPGDSHFPNQWIKTVQIKDGKWTIVDNTWFKVPGIDQL